MTKFNSITIAALMVAALSSTAAEPQIKKSTAQLEFDSYVAQSGSSPARGQLDVLYSADLPRSKENVSKLRQILVKKIPEEEKSALVRMLASMYSKDDSTQSNALIVSDLRSLIRVPERATSRAAILALTRMVYVDDIDELLNYALERKLISSDERYGELAHLLPYAPKKSHSEIMRKIMGSKNRYANDVLAGVLQSKSMVEKLDISARHLLRQSLLVNDPHFPMAIGAVGYIDLIRYAEWLNALAIAEESSGHAAYDEYVIGFLNRKAIDPRKILSFYTSPFGQRVLSRARNNATFAPAKENIKNYVSSFPTDQTIANLATEVLTGFALVR